MSCSAVRALEIPSDKPREKRRREQGGKAHHRAGHDVGEVEKAVQGRLRGEAGHREEIRSGVLQGA